MLKIKDGGNGAVNPSGAGRVRYRFRIAAEGFVLLIVMILVGFAAWHSGTNLLYLIFSVLIAFYLIHGGLLWINLFRLSVIDAFPEAVMANQPFNVSVELQNNKRFLASYALVISHETHNSLTGKAEPLGKCFVNKIASAEQQGLYYSAKLTHRGLHHIQRCVIRTRYPFGFEERSQLRIMQTPLLVLPETHDVAGIIAQIPTGYGDQESQAKGSGVDIYGLRDYTAGEHARNIHWPATARARKLIMTDYARDEQRQIMLLLDNGNILWQQGTTDAFETAITLTASIAKYLINSGFEVGLITRNTKLPPAQESGQLTNILRHLALLELVNPTATISADHDRIVCINYDDRTAGMTQAWQTIDSRQWKPPQANDPMHEKPQL